MKLLQVTEIALLASNFIFILRLRFFDCFQFRLSIFLFRSPDFIFQHFNLCFVFISFVTIFDFFFRFCPNLVSLFDFVTSMRFCHWHAILPPPSNRAIPIAIGVRSILSLPNNRAIAVKFFALSVFSVSTICIFHCAW